MNLKLYACLIIYLAADVTEKWVLWLKGRMESLIYADIEQENPAFIQEIISNFYSSFYKSVDSEQVIGTVSWYTSLAYCTNGIMSFSAFVVQYPGT